MLVWKEAWITPIHKNGSRDTFSKFRCVPVTSTISRLYRKVLHSIIEVKNEHKSSKMFPIVLECNICKRFLLKPYDHNRALV